VDEQLEWTRVAELTADIVAAYVSNHKMGVQDVPNVINVVGIELASLGTQAKPTVQEKLEPAVSVRRSVRPDHLVCLICGKKQKLLKRHLATEHELTPSQYPRCTKFEKVCDEDITRPGRLRSRPRRALGQALRLPPDALDAECSGSCAPAQGASAAGVTASSRLWSVTPRRNS
jgi:predicted transcriptional regulator